MIGIMIVIILLIAVVTTVFWGTHISMTKDHSACKSIECISFPKFYKLFKTVKWERSLEYKSSFFIPMKGKNWFRDYQKDYIHAGIVCINSVGYILYPWSYINFVIFCRFYEIQD